MAVDRPRAAVAVVAAGVKTPAGNTVEELWAQLCAGRPHATRFHDARHPSDAEVLVARDDGFDPSEYLSAVEQRRLDRAHALAIGAAQDALDSCPAPLPDPPRCAVVVGMGYVPAATYEAQVENLLTSGLRAVSPLTVPLVMPSSVAAHLSLRYGFQGPAATVCSACALGCVERPALDPPPQAMARTRMIVMRFI